MPALVHPHTPCFTDEDTETTFPPPSRQVCSAVKAGATTHTTSGSEFCAKRRRGLDGGKWLFPRGPGEMGRALQFRHGGLPCCRASHIYPEPRACRQYRIGLATVGDFQTSLESSHFSVAPIKSCTVCTERQNWRGLDWFRAFQEAIWNISFSISMGHLCASSGHPAPQHDRWLQPSLGLWHLGLPSGPYHFLAV